MPEWSAEFTVDEPLARRLIAGQCFQPRSLRRLGEGWDNTVWLADERWAFRFPRRAVAIPGFRRELAVLPKLRLPLPIPTPRFLGEPAEGFPWPWFGAELITGREPLGLTEEERCALGRPLGAFLRALHASEVDAELPLDPMGRADMAIRVPKTLDSLDAIGWPAPAFVHEARALVAPTARAVLHGDLHVRHVLVDGGALAGVIDWGDICRGDPAIDLMLYWALLPPAGREAFAAAYGPLDAARLLRARVMALNLCAVLVAYGAAEGMHAVEREAHAGLERATR